MFRRDPPPAGRASPMQPPAGTPEHRGAFLRDGPIHVIKRIAQAHDRFGVARHLQIAREEGGIAILLGVDQLQQQEELATDHRPRVGHRVPRHGPQDQRLRIGAQKQGEGQFHRVDQKRGALVRAQPGKD